jgi:hypothetical protein
VNVDLTTWGLEQREEYRVHFELLRNAPMDRVVAIDSDLVGGIISEMKGDGGMCRGASDTDKDFANDLIGIYSNRVRAEGAWLLPRSLWGSGDSRRTAARTGTGRWGARQWRRFGTQVILGCRHDDDGGGEVVMIQGDKLQSPAVRQEERWLFQRAVQYISDLWQLKWVVLIRGLYRDCTWTLWCV